MLGCLPPFLRARKRGTDLEPSRVGRVERLSVVEGVLDLMRSASRWHGEGGIEPDAILPHHNGYSMWFVSLDQLGTAPLTAEEILDRIDARALTRERSTDRDLLDGLVVPESSEQA